VTPARAAMPEHASTWKRGSLPRAAWLLLWCLLGGAAVQWYLAGPLRPAPQGFSAIFWYLLKSLDPAGNALLLIIVALAFALRQRAGWQAALRLATDRPGLVAVIVFVALCAGSLLAYRSWPLSMDEYTPVFQAKAFAEGRLAGALPPELLDRLVPKPFQAIFITVSPTTGAAASTYWPGFSLMLAPFELLGMPWMLNPLLGALSLLVIHRLAHRLSGSAEAGGWAILFALASAAFVVNAVSFYAMTAHLLANALFALLLLDATPRRSLAAGLLGALALNLHNPLPHAMFALPFVAWLALSGRFRVLACLAVGCLTLGLALGLGWKLFLISLTAKPAAAVAAAAATATVVAPSDPGFLTRLTALLADQLAIFTLPSAATSHARIAGLTKLWSWAAAGLLVLAIWGYWLERRRVEVRLLVLSLLLTFLGYLFVRFDQGHGWGFRYLHSAWFVLPVLGSLALASLRSSEQGGAALAGMAGWCVVLSLVFGNGLRLFQTGDFVGRHLQQAPPRAALPGNTEAWYSWTVSAASMPTTWSRTIRGCATGRW
jgi:hypothetical protein